jgi:hypothetical protein
MCHLLMDTSPDVQKLAYVLLQESAKKRTEHFVIEAGVDTDSTFKAALPQELISILLQSVAGKDEVELDEQVSTSWDWISFNSEHILERVRSFAFLDGVIRPFHKCCMLFIVAYMTVLNLF